MADEASAYEKRLAAALGNDPVSVVKRRVAQAQDNPGVPRSQLELTPPPQEQDKLTDDLDIVSRESLNTETSRAITNVMQGINYMGYLPPVPINRDQYGLTLYTKPNLNLSNYNLARIRKLSQLGLKNQNTYASAIRCYLDPAGHRNGDFGSALVDPLNCFIPLLTNLQEAVSGYPDPVMDVYEEPGGKRQETWFMYDGVYDINRSWPLTCTFRNMDGDPVSYLFDTWMLYGDAIRRNIIQPYQTSIFFKEIDYQTRQWRLVLDSTRQYVTKIGAPFAMAPVATNTGRSFDYNSNAPFNLENASLTIPFHAIGATYNDPILVREFNQIVRTFNPGMNDDRRESLYKKLPPREHGMFNYKCYLRINPDTMELERWVNRNVYSQVLEGLGI